MKKAIILFIISVVILISLLIYKSYTKSPIEPTQPAKKYIPVERLETVNYKKSKKTLSNNKIEKQDKQYLGPAVDEHTKDIFEKEQQLYNARRECSKLYLGKDSAAFDSCYSHVNSKYGVHRLSIIPR